MAMLDAACAAVGRDPATITRSAMAPVLLGSNAARIRARERALLAALGEEDAASEWLEARRHRAITGTPDDARAMVARYAAAGIERLMLQDFLPRDLEMIDLMAAELIGRV
jgi:alkanesulfonate monooxygenase SsuD/methylene tetrahydromethanopterin reductase-like flavin-dependent oxidoreductase (luciferase family)